MEWNTDQNYIGAEKALQGIALVDEGELEEGYVLLREAADAGNPLAMHAIGNMYVYRNFRAVEIPTLKLTMMPWDNMTQKAPDLQTGFSWFLKAAEAGYPEAMNNAGVMLYFGNGTKQDREEAKKWLVKAAQAGSAYAVKALKDLYQLDFSAPVSDAEYDSMLDAFCKAVENDLPDAQALFGKLTLGNDKQLCRLGYRLAVGRYHIHDAYRKYMYPQKSNGRSCAPVQQIRIEWYTVFIVNRSAFPEKEPLLSFKSGGGWEPVPFTNCVLHGKVQYEPMDFGWFRDDDPQGVMHCMKLTDAQGNTEKINKLLRVCGQRIPDAAALREAFSPCEDEAFFLDPGEKEFSTEICHICGGKAKALLRSTIGGWDQGDRIAPMPDVHFLTEGQ